MCKFKNSLQQDHKSRICTEITVTPLHLCVVIRIEIAYAQGFCSAEVHSDDLDQTRATSSLTLVDRREGREV
jgi:hypothetical protein